MVDNPKRLLGIHDHANYAAKWLDTTTPYSWLRAFEILDATERYAFLRENNLTYSMDSKIRGVNYSFFKEGIAEWVDEIIDVKPDVILYNICWYSEAVEPIKRLKKHLKGTTHIIRVHHDVSYLSLQSGFNEVVCSCDVAIVATAHQADKLEQIGFLGKIHVLPFGVDHNEFLVNRKPFKEREIDVISATNTHPARNLPLLKKIYSRLAANGVKVRNVVGLSRQELAMSLGNSKIFFLTSMTEASGSRIMLEAIAAGCYPVAFSECKTAKEVLQQHEFGKLINSGITLKMPQKKVKVPFFSDVRISNQIRYILSSLESLNYVNDFQLLDSFHYNKEVSSLVNILKN